MFDFFFQEEFWVETIISAIITGGLSVAATLITYNYKLKEIRDKMNDVAEHKDLTREHKDLSREHRDLSREHEGLSKEHEQLKVEMADKVSMLGTSVNENKEVTRSIKEMLVEDRTKSEFQYNNLTEKQKGIIDSVSRLNDFAEEMKILQSERNSLLEENKELKAENRNLKEQCRRKEQFISSLIEKEAHHEESEMEP